MTTIATWLSLLLATSARLLQTNLLRPTRPPPRLRKPILLQHIRSGLAWLLTFPSFTMRFSIRLIRPVNWPSKHSMMLSQVSTYNLKCLISVLRLKLTIVIELDTLSEESYKDSTLIMQLLRDNLVSFPFSAFDSVFNTYLLCYLDALDILG